MGKPHKRILSHLLLVVVLSAGLAHADPGPYDGAGTYHHSTASTGVTDASGGADGTLFTMSSIGGDLPTIDSGETYSTSWVYRVVKNLTPGEKYLATATISIPTSGPDAPMATSALQDPTKLNVVGTYAYTRARLTAGFDYCAADRTCQPSFAPIQAHTLACTENSPGFPCSNPGILSLSIEVDVPSDADASDQVRIDCGLESDTQMSLAGSARTSARVKVEDISLTPKTT